ncbi:twin-arginine translocase subunit TatC [Priestia filamentosa]|uniref:twin-arginine translocase subunit TatC n=1 Tax=Priestia filamentosa TaxID=1402861 RepID=UPI001FB49865|nr:twin-arginine translocase subunit TatC [Priestia filamentosa]MED3728823.1 twin-arginine translocase subunit TatC [Priestia filamentosa]UOE58474.1 twin-arginine translocase subunit TatC [Priestia filamentosa]
MENDHGELIEHLNELRQRIIKILFTFIIALVTAFIFVEDMYNWLVRDLDGKLAILGPGDILWVYMIISTICAIAFTIPVVAYQAWRFVKPALTREESMVTLSFIPGIFVLFITGISFGYFVLFPTVLGFLTSLSIGQFETMFTAEEYFRFMLHLSLPFGFLFEMPLVVMFLTRLGILNPMRLAKARKLSYFALIVVSVLITPPDFISDILVIVPLLLLYELSITISKFVYKKRIESDVSV